ESRTKGKGKRDLKQKQMIHYKANLRKTKGEDNVELIMIKTKIRKIESGEGQKQ
ncbi:13337_t:CDS:1, partial [Acaulospora morrowiae]